MRTPARITLGLFLAILCLAPSAPVSGPAIEGPRDLPSPAAPGSAEPHLAVSPEGAVWLSWLESRGTVGQVFRAARLDGDRWSLPVTITEGKAFFANWADFPTLLPLGGQRLAAQYLWKTGGETYACEVRITRSEDGGRTWSKPVVPHRDRTPTEHGFVSLLPAGAGVRAIWLDGRNGMATDSAGRSVHREEGEADMTLRTTVIGPDGALSTETLLDGRVCDCCQTSAVSAAAGVVVAYRDRSSDEFRDISVVRLQGGGDWSAPAPLRADGWKIQGCPVNGPALAAAGDRVAAAWYTAAGDTARVLVAFSSDGGRHFGAPVRVDGGAPLGRISVVMDARGAWVIWLERDAPEALFQLRYVSNRGVLGSPWTVARTSSSRASGFPCVAMSRGRLVFAWTVPGKPSNVRTAVAGVAGGDD